MLLTLSFVQAAFWSYHVTIVGILKPSSCLASTDTCLLLSSSSLVDIHFGFCDTLVSCFSSSRPHSSLVTAFFCLPPTICPCVLCPLLSRGDPGGRELIFCPTPSSPLGHIALGFTYPTGQHHEQQACLSFPFWSPFRSTIHPVTQARNLGLVLDFFPLPLVSHLKLSLLDLISSLL